MSQYPWDNTTTNIAAEDDSRYETPGGAQAKADKAEQDAKDYSDAKLALPELPIANGAIVERHYRSESVSTRAIAQKAVTNAQIADDAIDRRTIQAGAVGGTELDPSLLDYTTDIAVANKFNEIDAQLAEKAQQIKGIDVPYNYQGPVVTFVDDDITTAFITRMQPTLDAKGVKATLGAITGFVGTPGYMSKAQLTALQGAGHEIVSHTKTHAETIFKSSTHDLSLVTDSAIETEYSESRQWLIDNGFNGFDTLVYPWGGFGSQAVRYKRLARKYYKNAVNATGVHNASPSDNMYLNRTFININQDFTTVLKPIIDAAVANNGWLILGSHSGDTVNFNGTYLATVIDYIQSLSVPILTFGEAEKLKGNALSIGEFTDADVKLYVGKDGAKSGITVPYKVIQGIYTSTPGNTMNDIITKYEKYKMTVTQIQNTADPLTGQGGTLETYHGDDFYSFQRYVVANGRVYYRKWSGSDASGSWATWIKNDYAGQYSGTRLNSDPITNYDNGVEYADVPTANATGFPEGISGTLITYRNSAGDVFSYQEYHIRQSNKKYSRYWDLTTVPATPAWSAWVKVSAV